MALTFPGPKHIFDFDLGINELTKPCEEKHDYSWWESDMQCRTYDGEHITLHPMVYDSLDPGLGESQKLLRKFETRFLKMLRGQIPCSTVIVDTDSQWWTMVSEVKLDEAVEEARKKGAKRTEPMRLDYKKPNRYREQTILRAKQAGVNLVLIERAQELYDASGTQTGQFKPRGQGDTEALVQVVVRVEKRTGAKPGETAMYGVLEAIRFRGKTHLEGTAVKNLNYEKLCGLLFEEVAVAA